MPALLSDNDVRILREVVAWVKSARGVGVSNKLSGLFINAIQREVAKNRDSRIRFAKIVSSTDTGVDDGQSNPVQWTYEIAEVYKALTGYQANAWVTLDDGYSGTAYHFAEYGNDGTGTQINGVDHDGTLYSGTGFAMQPLQDNAIVPFITFGVGSGSSVVVEAWILPMLNAEDGECS